MDIKKDSRNYRKHSKENQELINKSLERFGAGRSILVDKDNVIIAGNGVYEQAEKLKIPCKTIETDGKELIVVKRTDLKSGDEKRKQLALIDNQTGDTSEFDYELIAEDFDGDLLDDFNIELPEDIDIAFDDEMIGKSNDREA